MDQEEPLMTPKEAARYTGFCVEHLRLLARKGTIRAYRLRNRYWMFKRSDLEAFITPISNTSAKALQEFF